MSLYNILIYSWYIFFALSKLGLWEGADSYLDKSAYYLKMYIAIMLLYYFNPLRRIEYTKYHKSMVITAATFIIITQCYSNSKKTLTAIAEANKAVITWIIAKPMFIHEVCARGGHTRTYAAESFQAQTELWARLLAFPTTQC